MEGKGIVDMIEKKLYNASLAGSVESLHALMQEDELTLARVSVTCFNETPLHVAAMLGHLEFARALLYYKPDLFVTRLDSEGRSPLHLASANGYIEIVRLLLTADPEVCLIRDEERRTPLHLAIMNGQIDVVKELVTVKPEATMYTLDQGETILHSCVIYNRLEALKFLMESRTVQDNYADIADDIGNTILHIATALKRVQIVKYLLNINEVKVNINAVNGNGFTALNTIENMPKDVKTMEIKELLISTGALRANDLTELPSATTGQVTRAVVNNNQISPPANVESPAASRYNNIKKCLKKKRNIIMKKFRIFMKKKQHLVEKKDDALLIAASVIAAMAYQSTLSPPGGLIGEEAKETTAAMAYQSPLSPPGGVNGEESIIAGTTILANYDTGLNNSFWLFNTISFIASLSIIFLFTSGLPINRRILIWLLRAAMWVTVSSMALAYLVALGAITPLNAEQSTMYHINDYALYTWLGLIGISLLVLICGLILSVVRKCRKKRALNNADEDVVQDQSNTV